ncbi:MAG: ketopantoate reductase family protein [Dokdonella sp.]|uniref:ketopantoate reductase family protein n=1 Tax=Dokdonella sp. TaxID=2291710 RepID=UPI0032649AC9
MRVLILGAGAIGGYFGARLIEAGHAVDFLVRSTRAAILTADGLRVHSERGDFARPVNAITSVDPQTDYDVALVSCKAWDLDSAVASIAPGIGQRTRVVPLLNGMRHLDALDAAFGASRVLGGLAHISVTLDDDGSIRQFGALERLTFGARDGTGSVPETVTTGLLQLGPMAVHSSNITLAMWEKFAFITTLAGATCLMRGSIGEIVATAEGMEIVKRLYAECRSTADGCGHALSDAAVAEAARILSAKGSPLKASMLRDLERGARTECEHILGDLRLRAESSGLDTPLLSSALAHLLVYESARLNGPQTVAR